MFDSCNLIDSREIKRAGPRQVNKSGETISTGDVCSYGTSQPPPRVQMLPAIVHIPTDDAMVRHWLQLMADFLIVEASQPRPSVAFPASSTDDLLAIRMLNSCADLRASEVDCLTDQIDARIDRALNAIHAEPEQPWTLTALCSVAGMSRSSFADRFSATVGVSPKRYLLRRRMMIAAKLLRSGNVSVGETGRRIGYGSEPGFSRAFKAHFGHSPKTARARLHSRSGRFGAQSTV